VIVNPLPVLITRVLVMLFGPNVVRPSAGDGLDAEDLSNSSHCSAERRFSDAAIITVSMSPGVSSDFVGSVVPMTSLLLLVLPVEQLWLLGY